jgi:hypothetical protein
MEPIIAGTLATALKPAGTLVGKVFKPITDKLVKEGQSIVSGALHHLLGGFQRYLETAYERHSYFVSIVLKNQRQKLYDLYEPLTIVDTAIHAPKLIDCFPTQELERVLNRPGFGGGCLVRVA